MDYSIMNIIKEVARWTEVAEETLKNYELFYHDYLDRQLGRKENVKYTSIEQWKQDINKLIIKNI